MTQSAYAKGIGEWLLSNREALGLSQADLAAAVGASRAAIATWEAGTSLMSAYSHAKLRAYFKQQKDLRAVVPAAEVAEL